MPFSSVSYCSYSDVLGLHSPEAAGGAARCPLLRVLSLASAASAQLSPPLLQVNKSTLTDVPRAVHIDRRSSVCPQFCPRAHYLPERAPFSFSWIRIIFFSQFRPSHPLLSLLLVFAKILQNVRGNSGG